MRIEKNLDMTDAARKGPTMTFTIKTFFEQTISAVVYLTTAICICNT